MLKGINMHSTLQRIIDITYRERLSHLSSCISAWPIIHEIYDKKSEDDIFILSNGHAGLALYCELEARYGIDPIMLLHKHGIHPNKDLPNKIYCSTGSLGSGLPIAVGHALADPNRNVYCLISDGETAEGSIWESLRFIYVQKLKNIHVYCNINGMSAYEYLDNDYLIKRLTSFLPSIHVRVSDPTEFSFAKGLLTHYYVLKEQDYKVICEKNV
jgi:transketolase N-terminal domain/subunit